LGLDKKTDPPLPTYRDSFERRELRTAKPKHQLYRLAENSFSLPKLSKSSEGERSGK
jgi:hypothetical protein